MKISLSDKYWKKHVNVSADPAYIEEQNRLLKKQATCTHDITVTFKKFDKFSERCETCHLVLRSDATNETAVKTHEQFL